MSKSIQVKGSGIHGYQNGWIAIRNVEDIIVFKRSRICVELDVQIKLPPDITLMFEPSLAITGQALLAQLEKHSFDNYCLELVNMKDIHTTIMKDDLLGLIYPIDISKRRIIPLKENNDKRNRSDRRRD